MPERFWRKVTSIEESKDLDIIHVEKLVGCLQTYKSILSHQKKGKSIAFRSVKKEHDYSFDLCFLFVTK
jgi:hypothetical protein